MALNVVENEVGIVGVETEMLEEVACDGISTSVDDGVGDDESRAYTGLFPSNFDSDLFNPISSSYKAGTSGTSMLFCLCCPSDVSKEYQAHAESVPVQFAREFSNFAKFVQSPWKP
jgi:hypothetical protein